jgi:hypothetical protein
MSERTFIVIDGGRAVTTTYQDGVDLATQAEAAGRPVAVDLEERAAYLGVPAPERARKLASLEAPDFTLPDPDGRLHSLSDHRGRKVFLVAYASW